MIRMFDRPRRARLLLGLLITAALVVVTIDYRTAGDGPLDRLGRVAVSVLGPIQEGLARIFRPVGSFLSGVGRVPSLKDRITTLERENAGLRAEREQVADVFRENDRLRGLLRLRDRLDLRTMPAQVIGIGPSNFHRTIFVDRGTADGVRTGMPVIGAEGLVGKVQTAGAGTSEIILVTDRSSGVAGRLATSGETGVVEGTGGRDLRFEIINPEARVKLGDQVVTSGYDGGVYPPGIPIGSVLRAPESRTALSRVVVLRPFVDFSTLDYVLLVTGGTGRRAAPAPGPGGSP